MAIYDIFAPLYGVMDVIFGWIFKLTGNQRFDTMFGILVVSMVITTIITLITARVVDQDEMRKNKEKMKKFQEKLREAQKKNNMKEVKKINSEMMKLQSYMFRNSFRPMIFTFIPIIIIFGWLNSNFSRGQTIATLPFALPHWGLHLGWFGWYIFCSISTSMLVKKILPVDTI